MHDTDAVVEHLIRALGLARPPSFRAPLAVAADRGSPLGAPSLDAVVDAVRSADRRVFNRMRGALQCRLSVRRLVIYP